MDVAQTGTTEQVEFSRLDLQCQTRATIDAEAVRDYTESIRNGVELPPGLVFRDTDGKLYLSSGFHRRLAYQAAGRSTMPALIRQGSRFAAIRAGIEDNLKHVGVRLSVADRRQAAGQLLRERPDFADRLVAKWVGLAPTTVAKVRSGLGTTVQNGQSNVRVGRDGRAINTAKLGSKPRPASDVQPERSSQDQASAGSSQADKKPVEAAPVLADEQTTERLTADPDVPTEDLGDRAPRPVEAAIMPVDAPEADGDRCSCGGDWQSDGEGGRFCLQCRRDHPRSPCREHETTIAAAPAQVDRRDAESLDDDPLASCSPSGNGMLDDEAADLFKKFFRDLGHAKGDLDGLSHGRPAPHYRRAMNFLDQADSVVSAWVHLEELEEIVCRCGRWR